MEFPINMIGWEVSKKQNQCETVIEEFSKIQKVEDHVFVRLPIFKLMIGFKDKIEEAIEEDLLTWIENKYEISI